MFETQLPYSVTQFRSGEAEGKAEYLIISFPFEKCFFQEWPVSEVLPPGREKYDTVKFPVCYSSQSEPFGSFRTESYVPVRPGHQK